MNNTTLKAFIDEYGDRICAFFIDNEHKILFGYPGTPKISDIKLINVGGIDMYEIPYEGKSQRPIIKYSGIYITEYIQHFIVTSPEDADYRVDPLTFR